MLNFTGECIEWHGPIDRNGYGKTTLHGRTTGAHRAAWIIARGEIDDGLVVDHLCRNRSCVNVNHMELVTPRENVLRGVGPAAVNAAKTECLRGHALEGDNLKIARGKRICRTCERARMLAFYHRTKVLAADRPVV